jgi:transcriptional regulator with XRE-family HTH domain
VKSLRAARVSRHWTLRRLVEEVENMAGQPTGLTESLISQWEHGNVRPSMRYRALVAQVFAPDEIDFDGGDQGPARGMALVTSHGDMIGALLRIVREAETLLTITGSRSREIGYLREIESAMAGRRSLIHYRELFGPPRNQVFKDHLSRLIEICDPLDRSVAGVQRLHVGMAPEGFQEESLCVSEKEALIVLPSLVAPGNFDTGLVLSSSRHARELVAHVQQLYQAGTKIETQQAVQQLPVEEPPPAAR